MKIDDLGYRHNSGIHAFPIYGDYAEKTDEILRLCGNNSFAFFFVDPLGWTDVGIPRLSKLLNRPKSEFLITFMYDHLNRFVEKAKLGKQVSEMLGTLSDGDYQKIQSLSPKDREKFIVQKYREQIMAAMGPEGNLLINLSACCLVCCRRTGQEQSGQIYLYRILLILAGWALALLLRQMPVGIRSQPIEFIDKFIARANKNIFYNQYVTTKRNPKPETRHSALCCFVASTKLHRLPVATVCFCELSDKTAHPCLPRLIPA